MEICKKVLPTRQRRATVTSTKRQSEVPPSIPLSFPVIRELHRRNGVRRHVWIAESQHYTNWAIVGMEVS
jgi:hypothetical protein